MTRVSASGVSVSYGRTEVLHGIDLAVEEGSWLGLIGPNGAGKSTLLKALAGLVEHTGDVRLGDLPISSMSRRDIARRVAYVAQNPIAPDDMTVLDYVLMGRTPYIPYLGTERAGDLDAAHEVLRQLDLAELARRELGSLSGGEYQRAVLGRALAQGGSVLMLDEPTNALDVGRQAEVLELVEELRRTSGLTVISAMHDLTLAAQFADRLVLLQGGRVVVSGDAAAVLTEAHVLAHYGARVRVLEHPDGGIVVAPRRTERT